MKLDRQPRRRTSIRAGEVLGKQAEQSVGSEVGEILRARAQELEMLLNPPEKSLGALSNITLLEQAAGGPLISEAKRQELLKFLAEHPLILTDEKMTNVLGGHFEALDAGAWVQLFPEEKDWARLDNDELGMAVRNLLQKKPVIISRERLLLNLMQIRPDKQAELRGVLDSDIEELWQATHDLFKHWNWLYNLLGRLAAWEVIHPEAKEQIKLSAEEKKVITTFMRSMSSVGDNAFQRFLVNASIVLADEVELQPNGQIRIQMTKAKFAGGPELPQRPLA